MRGAYAHLGLRVRVTVAETDGDEKGQRVRVADCVRRGVIGLERERVADTERLEGDGDSGSSLCSGVDVRDVIAADDRVGVGSLASVVAGVDGNEGHITAGVRVRDDSTDPRCRCAAARVNNASTSRRAMLEKSSCESFNEVLTDTQAASGPTRTGVDAEQNAP